MTDVYDSGAIQFTWNAQKLHDGWEDISITPNGPLKTTKFSKGQGKMIISKMANRGAVIEVTYSQTSETLQTINEIEAIEVAINEAASTPFTGAMTFDDPSGSSSFVALKAVLVDTGSHTYAEEVGERTITWNCETFINCKDPADVLSNLASYVRS